MKVTTVSIDKIIPYWRNPRKNDIAVEKVKASIQEFGYQTPIVVDEEMVIVAGHTRYRALKELGYDKVEVIISSLPKKKAKEYRIIDNRTAEYATWTDELVLELKEFTVPEFRELFFPHIDLEPDFKKIETPNAQEHVEQVERELAERFESLDTARANQPRMEVICPNCTETITILKTDITKAKNWTV